MLHTDMLRLEQGWGNSLTGGITMVWKMCQRGEAEQQQMDGVLLSHLIEENIRLYRKHENVLQKVSGLAGPIKKLNGLHLAPGP